ncbi:MAG TPA: hypothetical protein VGR43_02535 [Dehalococcoidia bacterium]|jgi:hypothetical protein|nr:hypothetical protein [Dehalococcoidia bacterium]
MADLPHPYRAYLRLQERSSKKTYLDDEYWGLDAALDALLENPETSEDGAERAISSAARKERHREMLRVVYLLPLEEAHDDHAQYQAIEARDMLNTLRQQVAEYDWKILEAVASGDSYRELAAELGDMPGALRTRVTRIRKALEGSPPEVQVSIDPKFKTARTELRARSIIGE